MLRYPPSDGRGVPDAAEGPDPPWMIRLFLNSRSSRPLRQRADAGRGRLEGRRGASREHRSSARASRRWLRRIIASRMRTRTSSTTLIGPMRMNFKAFQHPPQRDHVKPARAAVGGEVRAEGCDQDARGGDPPLETATCADGSEQPVARHVVVEEVVGTDAERPDEVEHGGPLNTRVCPSRRQNVYECPRAIPEAPQYKENLPRLLMYAGLDARKTWLLSVHLLGRSPKGTRSCRG